MFHLSPKFAWAAICVAMTPMAAAAQTMGSSDQEILTLALSAAPPQMRQDSTVLAPDGRVLQRGSNDFTCMLSGPPGATAAPMCLDSVFMSWAKEWQAGNRTYRGPDGVGLAYMLAGDAPAGGASNIDPFATQATANNQWVIEGPHVMVITPRASELDHLPTSSNTGGPYVMWRGTPYAHVMMPTGPRETSRQQAFVPDYQRNSSSYQEQLSEVPDYNNFEFRDPREEF